MPDEAVPPGFTLKIGRDGQRYYIEEGASEEKIQQVMQPVSTGEDVAKSIPSGLVKGAAAVAGFPGDIDALTDVGAGLVKRKLGVPEEQIQADSGSQAFSGALLPGLGLLRYFMPDKGLGAVPTTAEVIQDIEKEAGPLYEPQGRIAKGTGKIAEFAPNLLLGPVGAVRGGIRAAVPALTRRAITQVVAPAVGNEVAGQATEGKWYEPYARIAGTLLGGGLPTAVEHYARPGPVTPSRQRLVDTMTKENIPLTAGQRTGSRRLQNFETELGGEAYRRRKDLQMDKATQAAMRRIGGNETRATTDVVESHVQRMGNEFNRLEASSSVPLDAPLQNNLLNRVTHYQSVAGMPAGGPEYMMNRIADLAAQNGGVLDGEALKNIRSEMGSMISGGAAPETKGVLRDMQEALDDAIERNISPQQRQDWQTVRRQYRNFIVLEDALTKAGSPDIAEGMVPPQALWGPQVAQNQRRFATGQDDYSDLAHAGGGLLREPPQSGTAGRLRASAMPAALTAGALGVGNAIASGDIGTALGTLGGTAAIAAAPAIAGRAVMSRPMQSWLAGAQPGQLSEAARRQLLVQALSAPRLFVPPDQKRD